MIEVLIWSSVAATQVALIVSWFVSRQVVTPVQGMVKISQRIAEGNNYKRVQVPGNIQHDELDVLVHGGRIWVESAGVGKGSAFLFTLPVAQSQSAVAGYYSRGNLPK